MFPLLAFSMVYTSDIGPSTEYLLDCSSSPRFLVLDVVGSRRFPMFKW